MWIQIHIDIDFTKLGATAFVISFLRLRCGAHLIHQPTADNVHRRTSQGGEGGCSPPKVWGTQIFWAARENLGKASF